MGEKEHSAYYFDVADVDRMRKMYEMYEREAKSAIEAGLILPAHDYVLKTSHTFNILDTRGAVGVTERQKIFASTRELARQVAAAYVEQRQQAEFPWMSEPQVQVKVNVLEKPKNAPESPADFLLEIGTEELPPGDLSYALSQLKDSFPALMADLRLNYAKIDVWGTPRRLVVLVHDLAERQADLSSVVKGPPSARAFGEDGQPTRAAEGFARSKGIDVEDLQVEKIDGGEYVVARIEEQGQPAWQVLADALPAESVLMDVSVGAAGLATLLVDESGRYIIGPLGMAQMLRRSRAPYRFIGAGMLAPGVRHVLKAIGPWMYAHREYLPGATDACKVPAA